MPMCHLHHTLSEPDEDDFHLRAGFGPDTLRKQSAPAVQIPDQLVSLLGNPDRVGVGRAACQMDTSSSHFDEKKHIDGFESDRFHSKEIASQDLILVVSQEGSPGTRRSFICRLYPMSL